MQYLYTRLLIFISNTKTVRHIYRFCYSIKENEDLLGLFSGYVSCRGPTIVQIDLTNDCNNSCIGCWCYSPLLGDLRAGVAKRKEMIPFDVLKGLISELHNLKIDRINLSGGGEPLMYPKIMDVLELLKEKNIATTLITSFSLVDEAMVKRLSELYNCDLFVSLWAATPETYIATHPNKNADTFDRIKSSLKLLRNLWPTKKHPRLKMINVICNRNYFEIEQMIDLAIEVGAVLVEFVPIDIIPGKTEQLLLSEQQKQELLRILQDIKKRTVSGMYFDASGQYIELEGDLDLWERFKGRIDALDPERGVYDQKSVDRFPCYAGWIYSRIKANGDVIPCCKADRNPTGNIYRDSFSRIWNSKSQRKFRYLARNFHKSHDYFSKINCYKICDNLGMNFDIHLRLRSLSSYQKLVLRFFAWFYVCRKRLIKSLSSRSLRFILMLMLLFWKVIMDIYMLFLRLLYKKRIFPGG